MHSSYADFRDEEPETITEEVAAALNEQLASRTVPYLTSREQIHLVDIVECVGTAEKHRRSLDENGSRFLLFFRQHALRMSQHSEHSPLSWREITWAFFSGSQDILTDLVSRHFHGRMMWQQARGSGMFMWMTDLTALVSSLTKVPHPEANQRLATTIRSHSTERIYQVGRQKPGRLQSVLHGAEEKGSADRSLAYGDLAQRTSLYTTLPLQ
jgi:hypothetical protein